jgi:hypothetical protein
MAAVLLGGGAGAANSTGVEASCGATGACTAGFVYIRSSARVTGTCSVTTSLLTGNIQFYKEGSATRVTAVAIPAGKLSITKDVPLSPGNYKVTTSCAVSAWATAGLKNTPN